MQQVGRRRAARRNRVAHVEANVARLCGRRRAGARSTPTAAPRELDGD